MSNDVIGIDLGTTYSCACIYRQNRIEVIPLDYENRLLRSFVYYQNENEVLVGEMAEKRCKNTQNGIYDIKRIIGNSFKEIESRNWLKFWTFNVVDDGYGGCEILLEFGDKSIRKRPEEVYAIILRKIKESASKYLEKDIIDVVITIPAYFKSKQKTATKAAAQIAGLNVIRLIQEPSAAAIAFAFDKELPKDSRVLVYDFGGGTFDLSLLQIEGKTKFKVLSVSGLGALGGADIDNLLIEHFYEQIISEYRKKSIQISKNKDVRIRKRLLSSCREMKHCLMASTKVDLPIDLIIDEDVSLEEELTVDKFHKLIKPTVSKTINHVNLFMDRINYKISDIDRILLVGGSSRLRLVEEELSRLFKGQTISKCVNPDTAVAEGAAIKAHILVGASKVQVIERMPFSIGIATANSTVLKEIIPKNSEIPIYVHDYYITNRDKQTEVDLDLHEYDDVVQKPSEATLLNKLSIANIPAKKKGKVRIHVTYHIDDSGVLNVSAVAKYKGEEKISSVSVSLMGRHMSKEQVQDAYNRLVNKSRTTSNC